MVWLDQLPSAITHLRQRWSLTLSEPFEDESSCSCVAPCIRRDGTSVVLKLGMPHMEARSEIDGLLFWNGDPTVFVLASDVELNAMLLEYCQPGISLRSRFECEQDEVLAKLLRRLWRAPPKAHPFRHLSEMTSSWSKESLEKADSWFDAGLVREGLCSFEELSNNAHSEVLLATDGKIHLNPSFLAKGVSLPHSLRYHEDVTEHNGSIKPKSPDRLQCYFCRQIGRLHHFNKRMFNNKLLAGDGKLARW